MLKHQPFGWIKSCGTYYNIIAVDDNCAAIANYYDEDNPYIYVNYKQSFLYKDTYFIDGTPFGIEE